MYAAKAVQSVPCLIASPQEAAGPAVFKETNDSEELIVSAITNAKAVVKGVKITILPPLALDSVSSIELSIERLGLQSANDDGERVVDGVAVVVC